MSMLIETYNAISRKVRIINEEIEKAKQELAALGQNGKQEISARIKKLEDQLAKIDDYLLKIKGFQELAKKNLESQNVLTIEAPEGYRVNLNRLRNWSMMIDPTSANDPYAQRVFVVAKCDECFLNKKKDEFTEKLAQLRSDESEGIAANAEALEKRIIIFQRELNDFTTSQEVSAFAKKVVDANSKYWYERTPIEFKNGVGAVEYVAPGALLAPLPFDLKESGVLKKYFGKFYDSDGGRVLIPVEISLDKEFVLTVSCAPTKDKSLDKGIQNLILNIVNNSIAGLQKIYVIDGVRFNTSSVGSLKMLENTFAMEQIPRNQEQITEALEKIVSSFADIDEKLGECDSVKEYNQTVVHSKKIPLTTVVLYGWPKAYTGRNHDLLMRIMTNYERYGVSFVAITYKRSEAINEQEKSGLPEYASHNAIHIRMFPNDTTICLPEKEPQRFTWYVFNDKLSQEYVESVKKYIVEDNVIGSEYIKRFSLNDVPVYERGKKSISLPFGVDAKDQVHSISFDNENFAAYLMGASGSGKSTLLHTLITGIIRNYHPDDVELWLADFKMSEFAQYMDPIPPHVKYILLDESPELVYDLLDKLTEEMMERQRFFMRHRDLKKVENIPSNIYMPVIFVILDEFSIMSQAVAESEVYKLRLQNLLAKGRALGIKFIFASQTFTKGVAGLTQTAKDQIQTRIAMKNSYTEINETLELSSSIRTEQVKNWMEAMPPHYVLMKYRDADKMLVKRLLVMYFKGKGEEAFAPQRAMIEKLQKMQPLDEYNMYALDSYVKKNPVIVDGNSYVAFNDSNIMDELKAYKREHSVNFISDEMFLAFGSPRRMKNIEFVTLSNESRENILLLARGTEQACAMSIILSVMKLFEMQNGNVQIWTYSKNKLYRTYKDSHFSHFSVMEGMESICKSISELKEKINNKIMGNELIVLLGMEQICNDFQLVEFSGDNNKSTRKSKWSINTKELEAQSEEEKKLVEEVKQTSRDLEEIIEQIEEEGLEQGKTTEEIMEEIDRVTEEYMKHSKKDSVGKGEAISRANIAKPVEQERDNLEQEVIYNAQEDLKYIVRQGSRMGYHFILCLNNLSDIKHTQLQQELFRHKMAFQLSSEDSVSVFSSKVAVKLPEHICQYSDSLEQHSFRPYVHEGVFWNGCDVIK